MGDTQADYHEDALAKARNQLAAAEDRIRELEMDQETLLDDVARLNGCLSRSYELRRSAQERLAAARAEIITLRGRAAGGETT